jgi:hypothetical protein
MNSRWRARAGFCVALTAVWAAASCGRSGAEATVAWSEVPLPATPEFEAVREAFALLDEFDPVDTTRLPCAGSSSTPAD